LTKGRIASADGQFNRIRQVAPMYPPVRAHWRHLANTIELVLPSVHLTRLRNPNGKSIASAVFAQLTAVWSGTLAPPCQYDWTCTHWRQLSNTS